MEVIITHPETSLNLQVIFNPYEDGDFDMESIYPVGVVHLPTELFFGWLYENMTSFRMWVKEAVSKTAKENMDDEAGEKAYEDRVNMVKLAHEVCMGPCLDRHTPERFGG